MGLRTKSRSVPRHMVVHVCPLLLLPQRFSSTGEDVGTVHAANVSSIEGSSALYSECHEYMVKEVDQGSSLLPPIFHQGSGRTVAELSHAFSSGRILPGSSTNAPLPRLSRVFRPPCRGGATPFIFMCWDGMWVLWSQKVILRKVPEDRKDEFYVKDTSTSK